MGRMQELGREGKKLAVVGWVLGNVGKDEWRMREMEGEEKKVVRKMRGG